MTSLIAPNLPSSSDFLAPPMILPRPPGPTNPPPSESGFFFCFSTLTWSGLTIPEPVAPSPDPFDQPYLARRRSAKPFWPGRSDRGAFPSSGSSTGCSFAKVSSSSASDAGISSGGGGREYRTGARDMVAEGACIEERERAGCGAGDGGLGGCGSEGPAAGKMPLIRRRRA